MKLVSCPTCYTKLNEWVANNNKSQPDPGNLCICEGCGHISVFQQDLTLRQITKEELSILATYNTENYNAIIKLVNEIARKIQLN